MSRLTSRAGKARSTATRSTPSRATTARWATGLLSGAATVLAMGCSGGGCSSCAGSSAVPGGFPLASRTPNGGGARVTQSGLAFLQNNIPAIAQKLLGSSATGGVLTFPIATSSGSVSVIFTIDYTICPDGPDATSTPPTCTAEVNVGGLTDVTITSATPNMLSIAATVPIRLQDLPVEVLDSTPYVTLDDGSGGYLMVPITADVVLSAVPNDAAHAAREGYTSIQITNLAFDESTVEGGLAFHGSSVGSDILAAILNALKSTVASSLLGGLSSTLAGPLQSATCMKASTLADGTLQCPTGLANTSGTCYYEDTTGKATTECAPMLLGLESRFDLSSLFASLSPGTTGGMDLQLAGGGDMNPAGNGMSLSLFSGALPYPTATCITPVADPITTDLVLPTVIWPTDSSLDMGHDLAIGVSQDFLNHAGTAAYNSGLLCLGITTESFPSIPVGAITAVLRSITNVEDQFGNGDPPVLALAIRPQKPPVFKLGKGGTDSTGADQFTDPLIGVTLPSTAIDFYFWSENRFIRLFTGTLDISVPIDLDAGASGIQVRFPASNPITFSNVSVSNNTILFDTDANIAGFLGGIGSLIPTSALSNIAPFNISSALSSFGIGISIPDGGITTLPNNGQPYLGIMATLTTTTAAAIKTVTTASVTKVEVDPKSFELKTYGSVPTRVLVHAESDLDTAGNVVDYSYRVDQSPWTSWQHTRDLVVTSPYLAFEGKHTIDVASRVHGQPLSEGPYVTLPVAIDVHPPKLKVSASDGGVVKVTVGDVVTKGADLRVETRFDNGAWMPVTATIEHPFERTIVTPTTATKVDVRVTDESENVASTSSALIRGRPDGSLPAAASACGCSIPGGDRDRTSEGLLGFGALAAVAGVFERRRRRNRAREIACASLLIASSGTMGCSCASGTPTSTIKTDTGVAIPDADDAQPAETGSEVGELVTYVRGSYTSSIAASDGTIWVAGYHEGDPTDTVDGPLGDLIVGKVDPTSSTVAWVVVDGVPATTPTMDPNGFRGGDTDPGDDVGLFTSIVLDANGHPEVAYFDRTNKALRFARFDGNAWTSHAVDTQPLGWAGKYTSMILVGGMPVVAYQSMEPGTGGAAKAKIRLATATTATPASASDWTITDAVVEDGTPCIPDVCATGESCMVATPASGVLAVCMKPTTGCASTCTDVCVTGTVTVTATSSDAGTSETGTTTSDAGTTGPVCVAAYTPSGHYINAIGTPLKLASTSTGLAIVFYDRVHGNLRSAVSSGSTWTVTPASAPIDGWTGNATTDKTTGDRGIGTTIAIDSSGNWHLAYVDGISEQLLYKYIPGGTLSKASPAIVVDDGSTSDGTTKFTDGLHIIGEDSSLTVDASGNVLIVYQDSTNGTLRYARGPGGASAKFTHGTVTQDGFAGFWPTVVGTQIVNFYRNKSTTQYGDPVVAGDVRAVPLPSP